MVSWEFVRDTARLVHRSGLLNVLVTNGCASAGIASELLPFIDAMNIDLKGFRRDIYERLGGDLEMVKEFICLCSRSCHVELTSLIVPGFNDSVEDMEQQCRWIASLDPQIPLHITRFFPNHRMKETPPTSVDLMKNLRGRALEYLKFVYLGNV